MEEREQVGREKKSKFLSSISTLITTRSLIQLPVVMQQLVVLAIYVALNLHKPFASGFCSNDSFITLWYSSIILCIKISTNGLAKNNLWQISCIYFHGTQWCFSQQCRSHFDFTSHNIESHFHPIYKVYISSMQGSNQSFCIYILIFHLRQILNYNYCNLHFLCKPHKLRILQFYVVHRRSVSYNDCNLEAPFI